MPRDLPRTKLFLIRKVFGLALVVLAMSFGGFGQTAAARVGSQTAKGGFRNEDAIRDKFNAYKTDEDARAWLRAMGYDPAKIASLVAAKPHGEKADVEVRIVYSPQGQVRTACVSGRPVGGFTTEDAESTECTNRCGRPYVSKATLGHPRPAVTAEASKQVRTACVSRPAVLSEPGAIATGSPATTIECREGISIKLVSSNQGFNQIDKRWLEHYAKMWKMPAEVVAALKLFVGETPPTRPGRSKVRMFLDEIDPKLKDAVVKFFAENRTTIISDLFAGDGEHSAGWVMVAFKPAERTEWVLRSSQRTIEFYSEGDVVLTRGGNLKIGRITMQRKGGDAGRETAKMLQFKINPVELFNAK